MKKRLIIPMLAASFAIISCEDDNSIVRTGGPIAERYWARPYFPAAF